MIDWLLSVIREANIRLARVRLVRHPSKENYQRLARLVNSRSPGQVKRMESKRGLT